MQAEDVDCVLSLKCYATGPRPPESTAPVIAYAAWVRWCKHGFDGARILRGRTSMCKATPPKHLTSMRASTCLAWGCSACIHMFNMQCLPTPPLDGVGDVTWSQRCCLKGQTPSTCLHEMTLDLLLCKRDINAALRRASGGRPLHRLRRPRE